MNIASSSVKFSEIQQDAYLADLYSKIYCIPKQERVKVLMSWLANAYSDLLIPFLPEAEVLSTYTAHVRLIDTFANNSSYEVVAQLAVEFADNFFISQVLPNLLENYEKTAVVTYYIQIICENITCPSLIRKVMDIVTTHLSPLLIGRMTVENPLVAAATLSLLKTLLEYYCEDLWYELILQYLLPMKHLLTSQRQKMLPEIEFHESTNKLLELIPNHVANTVNTTLIAQHFLLYFQDEVIRLRVIDSAVASALPSSRSSLQKLGLGLGDISTNDNNDDALPSLEEVANMSEVKKTPGRNPTYPMWVFKYDGTDFLLALRRGYLQEEPEEFFEDDLFSATNQLNNSSSTLENEDAEVTDDGFSQSHLSTDDSNFEFTSLTPSELPSLTSIPAESIVKDKRKSINNLEEGYVNGAYFGPFLHALYEILNNWTILEPDVLFTATELISVLASSRIPLINTLFLDRSLTLQPSYPSFSTLIHSIKTDLDEYMKKYPDYIFRHVWKSATKECSLPDTQFLSKGNSSWDNDSGEGFVNTLKRTIASSRSFKVATEEVQRTAGRRGSLKMFADIFKSSTRVPSRPSEFRLLNRPAAAFESAEEEQSAKAMALRCVLFSHWMLELGAIAMQLCWGRRSFVASLANRREETDVSVDSSSADLSLPI